jgi:diaminopimelate epimerase
VKGTILYKLTGSGNDFVMLDGRCTDPAQWTAARIAALCDRRTGVGADGLVVLTPEEPDAVRMIYWNSDGSRAAMCGNAALCSARLSVYLEMV